MLAVVLASGSEGNSTYIQTKDAKILIDVGMNYKYINTSLNSIGIDVKDIDVILITHTHKDHVAGLGTFLKKSNPTVVLTKNMLNEMIDIFNNYENVFLSDGDITIGDTNIKYFKTSHDAIDSRGYLIEDKVSSIVYITDTGYLNKKFFKKLYNKEAYIIEANHDVEMLLNGPYPKWLKTRILSDVGHLSNNATGFYLSKLIGNNTRKIALAHLSSHNNSPEVAVNTVTKTLENYNITFDNIVVCKQREIVEVIRID